MFSSLATLLRRIHDGKSRPARLHDFQSDPVKQPNNLRNKSIISHESRKIRGRKHKKLAPLIIYICKYCVQAIIKGVREHQKWAPLIFCNAGTATIGRFEHVELLASDAILLLNILFEYNGIFGFLCVAGPDETAAAGPELLLFDDASAKKASLDFVRPSSRHRCRSPISPLKSA